MITETVHPFDGKREDKYVFSSIVAILFLAGILLFTLYPATKIDNAKAPKEIRQTLTELSNAAEEIGMIAEMEGALPSLQTLMEFSLEPIAPSPLANKAKWRWVKDDETYVGVQLPDMAFFVKLVFASEDSHSTDAVSHHYHIFWKQEGGNPLNNQSTTSDILAHLQNDNHHWVAFNNELDKLL